MTPLQFEARYAADWAALQEQVRLYMEARRKRGGGTGHLPGEQFAALYRRVCEQLSLARERAYPAYLVDRLERLARMRTSSSTSRARALASRGCAASCCVLFHAACGDIVATCGWRRCCSQFPRWPWAC